MKKEEQIIMGIIADIMEVDDEAITPEITLYELGADEFDMVEISMALERAIDIKFQDTRLLINPEKEAGFSIREVLNIASKYY